jgi:hypothetical protein
MLGRALFASMRRGACAAVALAATASATPPVVSVKPGSVRIDVESSSVFEALEALGRAAGFKVTVEGSRPLRPIHRATIHARTPAQAVVRLLDGQNLNYGLLYGADRRISSVVVLGAVPPTPTAGGSPAGGSAPPASSRPGPVIGTPPVSEEPEDGTDEPAAETSPTPAVQAQPAPTPPVTYGRPLGQPIGGSTPFLRPTPPPAPVPSPVIPAPGASPAPSPSPTPER